MSKIKAIDILQKRAIRYIAKVKYNDHTSPHFKQFKLLKLKDVYRFYLNVLMFQYQSKDLPPPLLAIFTCSNIAHSYLTRQRNDPQLRKHRLHITSESFICQGPRIFKNLSNFVKEAKTVVSFKARIKKDYLTLY